jgi:hypothetical protein
MVFVDDPTAIFVVVIVIRSARAAKAAEIVCVIVLGESKCLPDVITAGHDSLLFYVRAEQPNAIFASEPLHDACLLAVRGE